jgi:ABC-type glycerol-3-phosphate transport system substrate-binding protein
MKESELSGVSIDFWHVWPGEAGEVLQEIVDEFNRTNRWGIEVSATAFDGSGRLGEAVNEATIAGFLPDLLVGYTFQALQWDRGGELLVDLNTYVNDPVWGFSQEEQEDFYPVFWEQDVIGTQAKRLGIPFHRSGMVIFYNSTWAEELGYKTLPESLFDFNTQVCEAARVNGQDDEPSNDGTGGWIITPEASALLSWFFAFGGDIVDLEGRGYQFDTAETSRALSFLKELQDSGCAWTREDIDPAQEFASRRGLIYAGSTASFSAQKTAFREVGSVDKWTVIPFPSAAGQQVINTYGPSLVVPGSTSEEQMAAWVFIQWLVSPQNQAKWVRANGIYPTRASTLDFLGGLVANNSQQAAAVELLPFARVEPYYASWSVVRWALSDAMVQLFSPDYDIDQIPELLQMLDDVAAEVHTQVR